MAARRRKMSERAGPGGGGNGNGEEDAAGECSPRVLILGPPGAGKTTLAAAMAAKYGSVLVSVDAEAKASADAGSELGTVVSRYGRDLAFLAVSNLYHFK